MRTFAKTATIAGVAGVMALASMTPSEARDRGWAVAAGIGLAGAAIASAAANSYYGYYGPHYAYTPHYGYYGAPGYAYAPGYSAYAYAPGYSAYGYAPGYYYGYGYNTNTLSPWHERKLQGRDY
jgi:hypothetical protein